MVKKISKEDADKMASGFLNSGAAEKKLRAIIKEQGGVENISSNDIEIGALQYEYKADRDGVISGIDNKAVFDVCRALGNPFIKEAGLYFHKFPDQTVKTGDRIFTVFATNQNRLDTAVKIVSKQSIVTYK